jgi:hypothetical protein
LCDANVNSDELVSTVATLVEALARG